MCDGLFTLKRHNCLCKSFVGSIFPVTMPLNCQHFSMAMLKTFIFPAILKILMGDDLSALYIESQNIIKNKFTHLCVHGGKLHRWLLRVTKIHAGKEYSGIGSGWMLVVTLVRLSLCYCNPGVESPGVCRFRFTESLREVYANSNGASQEMCTCRLAYICKHSACLHTQTWAHNLVTQITLKVHSE